MKHTSIVDLEVYRKHGDHSKRSDSQSIIANKNVVTVDFIKDIANLRRMAASAEMHILSYLLGMAEIEARVLYDGNKNNNRNNK